MDSILARFNGDKNTKETLRSYFLMQFDREALEMMYRKEDVSHFADARILLEKAFENLDTEYGVQTTTTEETNQAA